MADTQFQTPADYAREILARENRLEARRQRGETIGLFDLDALVLETLQESLIAQGGDAMKASR